MSSGVTSSAACSKWAGIDSSCDDSPGRRSTPRAGGLLLAGGLVLAPDTDRRDGWTLAALRPVALDELTVRCAWSCTRRRSPRRGRWPSGPKADDDHGDLVRRRGVDASVLDGVVLAVLGRRRRPSTARASRSTASASISRRTVRRRPVLAEHVLVEALAGADAEAEPAVEHRRPPVAAAWARIAGWIRMDRAGDGRGHLERRSWRRCRRSRDQTNGLWPWLSSHGWKWSEIDTVANPAASACCACSTSARGPCSSDDRKKPNSVIVHLARA